MTFLRNQRGRRGAWMARAVAVIGVAVAIAAAACSRNAASLTSPSSAAPVNLNVAGGAQKNFIVSISNTVVGANQSVALHVTVTNCGASTGCAHGASTLNQNLGSAQIVIPNGFTITAVNNFSGDQGTHWSGSFSGQTVTVGASGTGAGTHKLTPGQSEIFDIVVTTPLVCDTFPIATPNASNSTFDDSPTFGTDWTYDGAALSLTTNGCTIIECPAAPSVAAHYLHFEKGVHPGSNTYQNIVSQVADHMGPQTDFNGINACTHPDYENAVKAFVDNLLP